MPLSLHTKNNIVGSCIILLALGIVSWTLYLTKDHCRKMLSDGTLSASFHCPGED